MWKYAAGLAFAVVLYGSILLHEVSHAAMAKHYGHPVTAITLHFLGGMTTIDGESRSPRQELMVKIVGPLTSIVVGLPALLAAVSVAPDGVLRVILMGLAGANCSSAC
ncbi:MAG: M50 family metallopeptidase [Nocardioides sp.]